MFQVAVDSPAIGYASNAEVTLTDWTLPTMFTLTRKTAWSIAERFRATVGVRYNGLWWSVGGRMDVVLVGRGTLEYWISELGKARLRWLRSQSG